MYIKYLQNFTFKNFQFYFFLLLKNLNRKKLEVKIFKIRKN